MRVRLLMRWSDYERGQAADLPEALARALIDDGRALPAPTPIENTAVSVEHIESADAPAQRKVKRHAPPVRE